MDNPLVRLCLSHHAAEALLNGHSFVCPKIPARKTLSVFKPLSYVQRVPDVVINTGPSRRPRSVVVGLTGVEFLTLQAEKWLQARTAVVWRWHLGVGY